MFLFVKISSKALSRFLYFFTEANKEFKLLGREIKMETRRFGFGHHIPF